MGIFVASPARPAAAAGARDRVFYSSMASAMAATVFVGFAPTFYLRPLFDAPATVTGATSLTTLAHVHGAVFTLWVVLFVVQTLLVADRRTRMHQRLGIAGGVLAAIMIVVGASTAMAAAARGAAPPGIDPLAFLIVPLGDIVLFALFVGVALRRRRDREAHKRLMLLAYVSLLAAATARLPGLGPPNPLVFFGLAFLFVLAGVVYDFTTRGRVHPVYVWGGALLVLSVPVRLVLSESDAWRSMAEFLTR